MGKQIILTGSESRQKLMDGIEILSKSVTSTLGPSGRNIIFEENGEVRSTKDGVSVAKYINETGDPIEELGIKMLKQAAIKTADLAGDGTTTSTLLAYEMTRQGLNHLNNGANAVEIKRGIDSAVKQVIDFLKNNISEDISSEEQLEQIATISANNDVSIGKLIAESLRKVGREGIVYIEESKTGETYLETVEGMQFEKGYKSHFFVTDNNTMTCTLNDVVILIVDKRLNAAKELLPILNAISSDNKQLLIIAEDVEGEVLATLIVNKMRGTLKVAAVKAPNFGDRRKLILEDIAILTGGKVVTSDKGMKLDKFDTTWLGKARVVTITKDKTTIIDGGGDQTEISTRIEELKNQIDNSVTPYEKEQLQERLSKATGGVAIIHIGGATETEIKEIKDRADDALHAAKSSIEEGIVPGGGLALLYSRGAISDHHHTSSDFKTGQEIVYNSLSAPFKKILFNAGLSEEKINELFFTLNSTEPITTNHGLTPLDKPWRGYNIKTEQFVNMKEAGIIDPLKVVKIALNSASSVAGTILLTEGVVVDSKEEKKDNAPGFDMSQMMGG